MVLYQLASKAKCYTMQGSVNICRLRAIDQCGRDGISLLIRMNLPLGALTDAFLFKLSLLQGPARGFQSIFLALLVLENVLLHFLGCSLRLLASLLKTLHLCVIHSEDLKHRNFLLGII